MESGWSTAGLKDLLKGWINPAGAMKADRIVAGLLMATAFKATEAYHPEEERIFEDRFARDFLPPFWRAFLLPGLRHAVVAGADRRIRGGVGMYLCRTRYIDDALRDALAKGCQQVVNMGAGLDTRAFRIPGIEQTRVFELDRPRPMAWKLARLEQMFGSMPSHATLIPIDFDRQDLGEELERAGFRTGVRTFFIWEGVTQYITAEAVDATFRYASSASAPGSKIAFTYIRRDITDGSTDIETYRKVAELVRRAGAPWVFGFDPAELEGYLTRRGYSLVEDIGAADYRARYLEPIGRQMDIFDGERMALARVVGA